MGPDLDTLAAALYVRIDDLSAQNHLDVVVLDEVLHAAVQAARTGQQDRAVHIAAVADNRGGPQGIAARIAPGGPTSLHRDAAADAPCEAPTGRKIAKVSLRNPHFSDSGRKISQSSYRDLLIGDCSEKIAQFSPR